MLRRNLCTQRKPAGQAKKAQIERVLPLVHVDRDCSSPRKYYVLEGKFGKLAFLVISVISLSSFLQLVVVCTWIGPLQTWLPSVT